jgi:peptidoglycan/xylan/chitin deacetylase (PgdA/CDA1 family)
MYGCFRFKHFIVGILVIAIAIVGCNVGLSISGQEQETNGIFLPIVMYHSIVDNSAVSNDYTVTPQTVDDDLKYLKDNGYQTVTIQNLVDYITNDSPLPDKPVMITADDGFYNNYCYLVPLLKKYGYSAIISFVGEFTDVTAPNDPHVAEYSYCTWDDIKTMLDSNVIELGNHTYNMHDNATRNGCSKLPYESIEEYTNVLTSDVGKLQKEFNSNLGTSPIVFAYPFGYTSKESTEILKSLGFKATLNCYEKPNYITKDLDCLFGLNRYNRSAKYSTDEFMEMLLST